MKEFEYTIKDELGIHARPAGMLVKEAAKYQSTIMLDTGVKKVDAKKIMALMTSGAVKGTVVKCTAEGPDEAEAITAIEKFFKDNL
ncbi:MAG: HPr family phosphocarrier protein [Lachnospiraceae bacterium]|nr:HPr family phosphocarrier protein [Lachnospiraceae bacterium]